MLPDAWGSDYDYAEAMGNHEDPEPDEWPVDDDEPSEADDEEMGAALSARCEVTR